MSSTKGAVFMALVAALPPAAIATAYLFRWTAVTTLSLPIKTAGILAYIYVVYNTTYHYLTDAIRGLPSPPGDSFFMGQALNSFFKPPGHIELEWMKRVRNDGIIAWRGMFHIEGWITPTTPEAVMEILNTHSYDWPKPPITRRILKKFLGEGLVVADGEEHKLQRKNVQPAFLGKEIKELVSLFWTVSISLSDLVTREAAHNGGWVEISALSSHATLDIIGVAGLGKEFNTTKNSDHELAQKYASLTDPKQGNFTAYFIALVLLPAWLIRILPSKSKDRIESSIGRVREISGELLLEKHRELKESSVPQKDIIATLMRSGKFSDQGLTDQLLTFLGAGHETTASALTWAIYLLSQHPEYQDRLRKECQTAFGHYLQSQDKMTAEIIDSSEFLEAVCNEALRLFPPVPKIIRLTCRDTKIQNHFIPKGTHAVISLWAMNRAADLWGPDAEEFKPERWMGAEGKYGGATSPYAFVTFLYGPRSCIGQSFARYEFKCLLAVLIMRHSFRLRDPAYVPIPEGEITIRPRDGMEVVVTPA